MCVHSVITEILPTMLELHSERMLKDCVDGSAVHIGIVDFVMTSFKDDFSGGSGRRSSFVAGVVSLS